MKKVFILVIVAFSHFLHPVSSQTITPDWTRYQSTGNGSLPRLLVDSKENIVMCGETYQPGPVTGYITTKYDSLGNQVWSRKFDSIDFETLLFAELDSSDNVYIGGRLKTQFSNKSLGILFKYDKNTGDTLWTYAYRDIQQPVSSIISKVMITPKQEILLMGNAYVSANASTYTFVVALNLEGEKIWEQRLPGSNGFTFTPNHDGYTIWGKVSNIYTIWKIDKQGNLMETYSTEPYMDSSGGPTFVDNEGNLFIGDNFGEYKVTKYNNKGEFVWKYGKPYILSPINNIVNARAEGLNMDGEGNLYFGGVYYDGNEWSHINSMLTPNGDQVWEHTIIFNNEYIFSGLSSSSLILDDEYIQLGNYNTDPIENYYQYFIGIYDKSGYKFSAISTLNGTNNSGGSFLFTDKYLYIAGANSDTLFKFKHMVSRYNRAQITTSAHTPMGRFEFQSVVPNPAQSYCTVTILHEQAACNGVIEVVNIQGAVLRSRPIALIRGEQQIKLDGLDGLRSGTYFIRVRTDAWSYMGQLLKIE